MYKHSQKWMGKYKKFKLKDMGTEHEWRLSSDEMWGTCFALKAVMNENKLTSVNKLMKILNIYWHKLIKNICVKFTQIFQFETILNELIYFNIVSSVIKYIEPYTSSYYVCKSNMNRNFCQHLLSQ